MNERKHKPTLASMLKVHGPVFAIVSTVAAGLGWFGTEVMKTYSLANTITSNKEATEALEAEVDNLKIQVVEIGQVRKDLERTSTELIELLNRTSDQVYRIQIAGEFADLRQMKENNQPFTTGQQIKYCQYYRELNMGDSCDA